MNTIPHSILMVANWQSDVGYAWWLMESYWVKISDHFHSLYTPIITYPKITSLSESITKSKAFVLEYDFNDPTIRGLIHNCILIRRYKVLAIYLTDQNDVNWRYLVYRVFGVKKILNHDHAPGERSAPFYIKGLFKGGLRRMPWITVDAAIGATDFVRKRLININRLPAYKCFSAPNGMPPLADDLAPVNIHREFKIPQSQKVMVMTGRANRYKGVPFALQCIARLKSEAEEYPHFLFVGDGPHLGEFKQLANDLGIDKHCTFPGKRNDIPEILESCSFSIHPSEGEVGYSLSILEYMRAGLPVIVPDDPSVCGATRHNVNGVIYKKGDVQAATRAIRELMKNDDLYRSLGENARLTAKNYSLEKTHKALLHSFIKTLKPKGIKHADAPP